MDKIIQSLPTQPGSYALMLHLPQAQDLAVGRLGRFVLPAGDYIYLGSARGSGGLRARLGRHLRGNGKIRWHIDYLRQVTKVIGFGYILDRRSAAGCTPTSDPTECAWSQKLAAQPGSMIPIPAFGASDCHLGCAAHLVFFPSADTEQFGALLTCEIHRLPDA